MFDLDDEEAMEERIDVSAFPSSGNWPPKMAERDEVGAFDVNPISWISSAAQGAFGSVQKKAQDEFGNVKVSVSNKKKKPKPKVQKVYVQAKEKVAEVSATGEWKTFAFGAGIALGAIGVIKAILK